MIINNKIKLNIYLIFKYIKQKMIYIINIFVYYFKKIYTMLRVSILFLF